ncbi:MAG: LytTR family transcriptional regulator, partial [Nannocystaceae bacterium]|nr:LytTR family transcriptional regulator [Nannocystaceae bacterium]
MGPVGPFVEHNASMEALDRSTHRLFLHDGGRTLCIPIDEIEWVAAAGNYIEIHTGRKTHLVRHTVKAMEAKLNPDKFLRVRPSAIVAVSEVD